MCSGGRAFGVGLYKKAKLTSQALCFSPEFLEALAHVLSKARLEVLHLAERLADLVLLLGGEVGVAVEDVDEGGCC